jgi:hypothetical protein
VACLGGAFPISLFHATAALNALIDEQAISPNSAKRARALNSQHPGIRFQRSAIPDSLYYLPPSDSTQQQQD